MIDRPAFGDRSALRSRDRGRAPQRMESLLNASPTGRNLLVGSDAEFVFDADPTGTVGSWPDGARGIAVSGGDLLILRYTRETGWKSVTLT